MRGLSRASAPAKVILFGEHFVVYDKLAVVMAVDLRAHVSVKPRMDNKIIVESIGMGLQGEFTLDGVYKPIIGEFGEDKLRPIYVAAKRVLDLAGESIGLNITVDSRIPVASGLGSSAAVLVATTAAVGSLLEMNLCRDDIFRLALEAEKIIHEKPSGVDPAISTYGGLIAYSRSGGVMMLEAAANLPLVIGDTRIKRDTREMIHRVSELRRLYPEIFKGLMDAGDRVARLAVEAIRAGDLRALGHLMNINHALLYAIGVSNTAIESLLWAARRAGALGAKITGAGGGGCIVALSMPEDRRRIAEAIRVTGGEPLIADIAHEGVRIEE
ncbi:MAG: mevalonate kinase [Candidatus Bathyarchaeia archaeon]|nr:mevalonate kinase [Candidatus Bathyarchaeota archaeon]